MAAGPSGNCPTDASGTFEPVAGKRVANFNDTASEFGAVAVARTPQIDLHRMTAALGSVFYRTPNALIYPFRVGRDPVARPGSCPSCERPGTCGGALWVGR